ncbi:hypothetical protein lerEdw1_006433 [Lerista edwardsae]|nr:hypothetical protein lerEdw1_006433 [Lerista edwardsae]
MERAGKTYVNRDEEDEMEVSGYSPCCWRLALVSLGTVCSGGLLLLLLYWLPEWSVKWTCRAVPLRDARVLLLRTTDEFWTWSRVRVCSLWAPGSSPLGFPRLLESRRPAGRPEDGACEEGFLARPTCREQAEVRFFAHHNVRYLWQAESQSFRRLTALDRGVPCSSLHTVHGAGLPGSTQDYRRLFYGANQIDVEVPSLLKLLLKEVLNPFYVFQAFSVVLWSLDDYHLYASAILFMSLVSIGSSLHTIRKQYVLLRGMVAAHNIIRVTVYRGPHETEEIFSTELVPGDVLLVPPAGLTLPCDAVLLSGTAIANESLLTGESVPVTKTALPNPARGAPGLPQDPTYDPEEHRRHTLFCGTAVIQTRYYAGEAVQALVVRTGFYTSKGRLVCSILFPKPTDFRLYRDAYRFLLCLVGVAGIGMLYSVVRSVQQGEPVGRIIRESLDILTITVPPALPAAMTAGVVYAQRRLRARRIFSISPQRINVCGQLNLMCFDKVSAPLPGPEGDPEPALALPVLPLSPLGSRSFALPCPCPPRCSSDVRMRPLPPRAAGPRGTPLAAAAALSSSAKWFPFPFALWRFPSRSALPACAELPPFSPRLVSLGKTCRVCVCVCVSGCAFPWSSCACCSPFLATCKSSPELVAFGLSLQTGTLTEDGLDFWGFVQAQDGRFQQPGTDARAPSLSSSSFVAAMAACHALTTIGGRLSGDPLELKMFEATGWILEEPTEEETALHDQIQPTVVHPPHQAPSEPPGGAAEDEDLLEFMKLHQIGILVRFPFSSSLQRMSVVARTLGEKRLMAYTKGAPETVVGLCRKETGELLGGHLASVGVFRLLKRPFTAGPPPTGGSECKLGNGLGGCVLTRRLCSVPGDFSAVLESYTGRGLRVLALASRRLESRFTWHKVQHVSRDVIESGLDFLGLLLLQNKLKPETGPVLAELRRARIRSVMVTGDNLLTAVSVGRECGMIPAKGKVVVTEALPPPGWAASSHQLAVRGRAPGAGDHGQGEPEGEAAPPGSRSSARCAPCGLRRRGAGSLVCLLPQEILMLEEEAPPPSPQPGVPGTSYHFALSGKSFSVIVEHFPDLLPKLLLCGTIYARMAPDQKTQLVDALQQMDYYVGMCGDGANDCGALKRAHAGISLSELEASVASPFTSKTPNISCVPDLIREGRAALVTSFCVFKFMALYSIIQYLSVLLLYSVSVGAQQLLSGPDPVQVASQGPSIPDMIRAHELCEGPIIVAVVVLIHNCGNDSAPPHSLQILSNLGDVQYLFIDVAIIMSLAFTMSLNRAWRELVPQRPPTSLVSPQLLLSVLSQILLALGFQVGAFLLVREQPWYCHKEDGSCALVPNVTLDVSSMAIANATARQRPEEEEEEHSVRSFENTTLFHISCFQYIAVALAFAKGRPFRQPTRTNGVFVASLVATSAFLLLLLLWPGSTLDEFFELDGIPYEWRLVLLVLALSNVVLSLLLENFVCDCDVLWQRVCYTKRKYEYPHQATYPQLELDELAPVYSWRRHAPPRAKYKRLAQELLFDPDWPPQLKTSARAPMPPAESSA